MLLDFNWEDTVLVPSVLLFREAAVLGWQRLLARTMPGKPRTGGPSQRLLTRTMPGKPRAGGPSPAGLLHAQVPACAGTRGRKKVSRFRPPRQRGR